MKIELHLKKNGYNSSLTIDGKPVYFSRLAILVDCPGPTKIQLSLTHLDKQDAFELPSEGIEIIGDVEPGNLFVDILGGEEEEPRAGRSMRPEGSGD